MQHSILQQGHAMCFMGMKLMDFDKIIANFQ